MKLYIRNMVCRRCKMVVKFELEKLGIQLLAVSLGEVETIAPVSDQQRQQVSEHLKGFGFELIDDPKSKTIARIKTLIIELVHHHDTQIKTKLSTYLSSELLKDYATLSNLFSEVEGTTIEKYYIIQKVEKVKELLVYNELTLTEIAFQMNYSSVAYLSNQFKKVTGFSPSHFKHLKDRKRMQIEDL